jgi:hypothetical protein
MAIEIVVDGEKDPVTLTVAPRPENRGYYAVSNKRPATCSWSEVPLREPEGPRQGRDKSGTPFYLFKKQ